MKPVELSEFDVNRIIYEETRSVVKDLLNERPFHDDPLAGLDPDTRRAASQQIADRSADMADTGNKVLMWILSNLLDIIITPAYAPGSQEEVEKLDAERWAKIEMLAMLIGMFPGIGDVLDIAAGIYYMMQGRNRDAAFSFISAAPMLGIAPVALKSSIMAGRYEVLYEIFRRNPDLATWGPGKWEALSATASALASGLGRFAGARSKELKQIEKYMEEALTPALKTRRNVRQQGEKLGWWKRLLGVRPTNQMVVRQAARMHHLYHKGLLRYFSFVLPVMAIKLFLLELLIMMIAKMFEANYVLEDMGVNPNAPLDVVRDKCWVLLDGITAGHLGLDEAKQQLQEVADEQMALVEKNRTFVEQYKEAQKSFGGRRLLHRLAEDNLQMTADEVTNRLKAGQQQAEETGEPRNLERDKIFQQLLGKHADSPENFVWPEGQ